MSVSLVVNGATYQYPQPGDTNWGVDATGWASAVTTGMLQKAGGAFTLTAEVDFGATFGLKSIYYKTRTADIASAGQFRLAQADVIAWRNAANNADLNLSVSSDLPFFDGNQLAYNSSLAGYQPLNSLLTAISGLASNGIIVRTSSSTSSARTITGTSNRIVVTDGDGVAGNPTLDIGTDVVTLTGSQVLTNKTIDGNNNTLTVLAGSQLSGVTPLLNGGTGVAAASANAAFNALSPNTTKGDITVYSGTANVRLPVGSNTQVLVADSSAPNGMKWDNAPAGGGSKNYLTNIITSNSSGVPNPGNGNFELGTTTGWSLGTVALTSNFPSGSPTFGSGASGNLSISTVSSGQLAGLYSLSYASSAATTGGNFLASDAFYIDTEDQAKAMTITFRYLAQTNPSNANWSGTSANSFGIAIYDVTNSAWIQPAGVFNLVQSAGVGIASATFQTTSNSTQYRLVVYNANATSGAVTVYFDDFSVGPNSYVMGPPMSDEVSADALLTPNATRFGTIASQKVWQRRVGSMMEVRGEFVAGTLGGTGTDSYMTLNGVTLDTSLFVSGALRTLVGNHFILDNGGANFGSDNRFGALYVDSSQPSRIYFSTSTATNVFAPGVSGSNSSSYTFKFTVPITGWSSNTVMSSDTATNVVALNRRLATASVSGTYSNVTYTTADVDTNSGYSGSTYTVPVSGLYSVYADALFQSNSNQTNTHFISINQNGSLIKESNQSADAADTSISKTVSTSAILNCKAGDTITIQCKSNATSPTLSGTAADGGLSIQRLSGPAIITATDTVLAKITGTPTGGAGAAAILIFPTVNKDTTASYNASTGRFTCPVSGDYRITTFVGGTNATIGIVAYKNAVSDTTICYTQTSTSAGIANGSTVVTNCLAGDLLDVRVTAAIGSLSASSVIFERIK